MHRSGHILLQYAHLVSNILSVFMNFVPEYLDIKTIQRIERRMIIMPKKRSLPDNQITFYQTPDATVNIEVMYANENIRLSQKRNWMKDQLPRISR